MEWQRVSRDGIWASDIDWPDRGCYRGFMMSQAHHSFNVRLAVQHFLLDLLQRYVARGPRFDTGGLLCCSTQLSWSPSVASSSSLSCILGWNCKQLPSQTYIHLDGHGRGRSKLVWCLTFVQEVIPSYYDSSLVGLLFSRMISAAAEEHPIPPSLAAVSRQN